MKNLLEFGKASLVMCFLLVTSCAPLAPNPSAGGATNKLTSSEPAVIRYDYKPKEINEICNGQMKATDTRIEKMLGAAKKNFQNTVEEFETIMADFNERTTPATFMYYVSTDKNIRAEANSARPVSASTSSA